MNLPELFLERMSRDKDFDLESFIKSYNAPAHTGIRINPQKSNSTNMRFFENLEKVDWCNNGFYVNKEQFNGSHPYHMAGLIYFQEPSAMCAAELLPVESGDIILDLCAAPGGKTTQIASVHDNSVVVSNEIVTKRSHILSENVERMGLGNVIVINESPERLEKKYPSFFDKIVIDAPCSGEGMFKKEPAAVEAWSEEHVLSCASRQQKIIDSAMKMLKQGGGLVYSTCTFAKEENENNVNYILEKYPYMKVGKITKLYPHLNKGEGHFAAFLYDSRKKNNDCDVAPDKELCSTDAIKMYKEFEKQNLNLELDGKFVLFGENLYLEPADVPIDGIKTVRPGLHLGMCKKGRFEPGHALAKAFSKEAFKKIHELQLADADVIKYLKGETLVCDLNGFVVVTCDGLPLGWGKCSGGVLKNKFPKGLRIF